MKRNLLISFALITLFVCSAVAQRTVSGKITDESGEGLPGVNVVIKGTTTGVTTDLDGNYQISVDDGATLVFSFVGFETQEVAIGSRTTIDVTMGGATELQEVVVTGVSVGTSTKKVGFAVGKVDQETLQKTPAVDPANALRAKVPGVRVVSPSGLPGSAPSIRLRGSNSIQGSQSPLIIVDGVITSGSLQDIDIQSIASIEVIKGAAAASLYGSLAGNGVVQIITKRGANVDKTRVTVRSEVGSSFLQNTIDLATHHNYAVINGSYRNPNSTPIANTPNAADAEDIVDNPYDQVRDQQKELFNSGMFSTQYVGIESRVGTSNYLVSYERTSQEGIIESLPNFVRNNVRLNLDVKLADKVKFSASNLISVSTGPNTQEQGQGNNLFYSILLADPDLDLKERDANGNFNPLLATDDNIANPLYAAQQLDFDISSKRFVSGLGLQYDVLDWWKVEANASFDRREAVFENVTPAGFITPTTVGTPSVGAINRNTSVNNVNIYTLRSLMNKQFDDLRVGLALSYQFEDRNFSTFNAAGSDFLANGIPRISNTDPANVSANDAEFPIKAENYLANITFDYKDKYILDMAVRREGVSLFGEDERFQTYYRASIAYRINEDLGLPWVNEWKLRANIGTSGQRPVWAAQYETYNVGTTGIVAQTLGNRNIKPSRVTEVEVGTNLNFLDRFSVEANYAKSKAEDQFLLVPLTAAAEAPNQWQNAGTLESNTIEFAFGAFILDNNDWTISANVNIDRVRQEITELRVPEYIRGRDFGTAINVFQIKEGVDYGVFVGNRILTSIDQVRVDANGYVLNAPGYSATDATNNVTVADLTVNRDGYVVIASQENTVDETPLFAVDENAARTTEEIGNAIPDFNLGFNFNVRYKNLSLYALIDWQKGGDVYNYTKQLLYFNQRHGDMDQSGFPDGEKKYAPYYSQQLYNAANSSSHFIEDGTFVKLREISLTYNFDNAFMDRVGLGNVFHDAKFSLIGRNVLTITDYTGFDPEVAVRTGNSNPSNFTFDEFAYPNLGTYSAALQLRF